MGIEEIEGVAQLPPIGIPANELDDIQKKIRGQCNRISPEYYPIVEPIDFQEKKIIVIWCPAGEARPYQAPPIRGEGTPEYFIRQASETVVPKGEIREELLRLTSRIPFDDRAALSLTHEVLEDALIRKFLLDTNSKLSGSTSSHFDLCADLRIIRKMNGHFAPLHVGLLFFTSSPHQYLSGAKSEVVQFGDEAGKEIIENNFTGPIDEQIKAILRFLESTTSGLTQKIPNQAESLRFVAFPFGAMEEAIVNAFYHRGYDASTEPVKVYLYPDRMEIISYPGPVPGIKLEHFLEGNRVPPVANRNRRIGDFLKQLRLAEMRNTGITSILREMKLNGSPTPKFDFDEERTYFRVTLPAHPKYLIIHTLSEAVYLWSTGQKEIALERLSEVKHLPDSGAIWGQIIEYKSILGGLTSAESAWNELSKRNDVIDKSPAARTMARVFLNNGEQKKALNILKNAQFPQFDVHDLTETALLYKNLNDLEAAHRVFQSNAPLIHDDSRALNEFADVKLKLAKKQQTNKNYPTMKRLLNESSDLYRRVIQLTKDDTRKGWCWFRLAEIFSRLKRPNSEIEIAYAQAKALLPNEHIINEQYNNWKIRRRP